MALTPQPLFRAQDVGTPTTLGPVVPKDWRVKHGKTAVATLANANAAKPRYNQADYSGGARGDDVAQSTRNTAIARPDGQANDAILATELLTQSAKATALGVPIVQDVGRKRGWIAPSQPYAAPPAAPAQNPTVVSLVPNTAVAGAATPQFMMKITGTKFTPYTSVVLAGVEAPLYTYISPTEMRVQMSPGSSVAGTTSVTVIDHGVTASPALTFTWT